MGHVSTSQKCIHIWNFRIKMIARGKNPLFIYLIYLFICTLLVIIILFTMMNTTTAVILIKLFD